MDTKQYYQSLGWEMTDGSLFQFGRKIAEGVFEFKEFDRNNYSLQHTPYPALVWDDSEKWVVETIELKNYSAQEFENHISAYYNSLDEVKEEYGNDWEFIVAECIFEQTCGLY